MYQIYPRAAQSYLLLLMDAETTDLRAAIRHCKEQSSRAPWVYVLFKVVNGGLDPIAEYQRGRRLKEGHQ